MLKFGYPLANPGGRGARIVRSQNGTAQPTLAEIGVDKKRSAQAQKLADIPEERLNEILLDLSERDKTISPSHSSFRTSRRATSSGMPFPAKTVARGGFCKVPDR